MEIDVKKNINKDFEFISVEGSNSFDVNKLQGVKNVGSTFILNKSNNVLTKKTELELKQYFSKNREELISILKQILEINKNDFKEENENLLKSLVSSELDEFLNNNTGYFVSFNGNVNELPENPKTGEIYGLIGEDEQITYYMFLEDKYVILLDKKYYDENFYNKTEINFKISDLSNQLNEILLSLESKLNSLISKDDLNKILTKISAMEHNINELKASLNI